MDKIGVTGMLFAAMLYANISSTHADMRVMDTDTLTLAYANAMPAALVTPLRALPGSNHRTVVETAAGQSAGANSKHFTEYLQLHKTRPAL